MGGFAKAAHVAGIFQQRVLKAGAGSEERSPLLPGVSDRFHSTVGVRASAPDLAPYDPIIPTQDLNEKNPQNTAAARLSEILDLSAPDRVDDQLYNPILWLMLKGDVPLPSPRSHAALHALQSSK